MPGAGARLRRSNRVATILNRAPTRSGTLVGHMGRELRPIEDRAFAPPSQDARDALVVSAATSGVIMTAHTHEAMRPATPETMRSNWSRTKSIAGLVDASPRRKCYGAYR